MEYSFSFLLSEHQKKGNRKNEENVKLKGFKAYNEEEANKFYINVKRGGKNVDTAFLLHPLLSRRFDFFKAYTHTGK